jgi:hypothetical protein
MVHMTNGKNVLLENLNLQGIREILEQYFQHKNEQFYSQVKDFYERYLD